jgi:hypothetical protein
MPGCFDGKRYAICMFDVTDRPYGEMLAEMPGTNAAICA